jgi:hypothetical protein
MLSMTAPSVIGQSGSREEPALNMPHSKKYGDGLTAVCPRRTIGDVDKDGVGMVGYSCIIAAMSSALHVREWLDEHAILLAMRTTTYAR